MNADDILLYMIQQGLCFYCDKPMSVLTHPQEVAGYTRDHFYSAASGNGLTGNKVLAHHHCNNRVKGGKLPTMEQKIKFNKITQALMVFLRELEIINKTLRK